MTKALTQPNPRKYVGMRFSIIMAIVTGHVLGWFWLSGFTRGQGKLEILDQLLCPFTFVSCLNPQYVSSWMQLLILNVVTIAVWVLFLLAARSFVVGRSLTWQLLGLAVSVLIPLAVLAVFFIALVLSNIS